MGKNLKGKECGKGIYQRKDGLYSARFVDKTGKVIEGKQKYYFDTTNLIIDYLTEIGIKRENIFDSNICSVCNVANMYSYRAEKEKSDRNMNIVMLK